MLWDCDKQMVSTRRLRTVQHRKLSSNIFESHQDKAEQMYDIKQQTPLPKKTTKLKYLKMIPTNRISRKLCTE